MRLPRTLMLPFGYTIRLKFVSAAELKEEDASELDGYWDAQTRTIYIRRRLPVKRLRYMIGHEMQHALVDYMHAMLDDGIAKN